MEPVRSILMLALGMALLPAMPADAQWSFMDVDGVVAIESEHAMGFRYTTAQGMEIYGTPVCVSRRDEPGAIWDITDQPRSEMPQ